MVQTESGFIVVLAADSNHQRHIFAVFLCPFARQVVVQGDGAQLVVQFTRGAVRLGRISCQRSESSGSSESRDRTRRAKPARLETGCPEEGPCFVGSLSVRFPVGPLATQPAPTTYTPGTGLERSIKPPVFCFSGRCGFQAGSRRGGVDSAARTLSAAGQKGGGQDSRRHSGGPFGESAHRAPPVGAALVSSPAGRVSLEPFHELLDGGFRG